MTESNNEGATAPTGLLRPAAVFAGARAAELAEAIGDECGRPLVVVDSAASLAEAAATADLLVIVAAPDGIDGAEARHVLSIGRAFGLSRAIVAVLDPVAPRGGPSLDAAVRAIRDFSIKLGYREIEVVGGDLGAGPESIARAIRRVPSDHRPLRLVPREGEGAEPVFLVTAPMAPGRQVILLPSGRLSRIEETVAKQAADADVGFRLAGDVMADEGGLIADAEDRPEVADQAAANILWLGDAPLLPSRPYVVRTAAASAPATVTLLRHRLNTENLDEMAARRLAAGDLGQVNLSFARPLVFDRVDHCPPTAAFTLHESEGGPVVARGAFRFALRRATNIHWQALAVDKPARAALKGQAPACLWFTGLSGSGKSTVASLIEKRLHAAGHHTYTLDGDNVRHGLNRDLGFTDADRVENIRRVGEVAKLFVDAGLIVLVSFISPFQAERRMARALFGDGEFLEVHVDTPLEVCEQRDPKGLYKKARAGQLKNFTGIDSAYEVPEAPELRLDAGALAPEALVEQVLAELTRRGIVEGGSAES